MKGLLPIAVVVAALAAVPLVVQSNTMLNFLVVTLLIVAASWLWWAVHKTAGARV